MTIQELLKKAFEAGQKNIQGTHDSFESFEEWLEENTLAIYQAIEEFNQEQKKQRDLDSF